MTDPANTEPCTLFIQSPLQPHTPWLRPNVDVIKRCPQPVSPLTHTPDPHLVLGPALSLPDVGGDDPLHLLPQVRVLAELQERGNTCTWEREVKRGLQPPTCTHAHIHLATRYSQGKF